MSDLVEISQDPDVGEYRYLLCSIGAETFVAPLLSIREIVEPLTYQAVPNDHDFYLGLANLRGQIVGVLDLGSWFKLAPSRDCENGAFLVFDVDGTSLAGFVHRVISVVVIPPDQINQSCKFATTIPQHGLKGIATVGSKLVPIVHLPDLIRNGLQATG